MSEPLFDGYDGMIYPGRKRCVRCLRFNNNPDYPLCDDCREGDRLAKWFEEPHPIEDEEVKHE